MRPCLELSGDPRARARRDRVESRRLATPRRGRSHDASSFFEAGLVNHVVWYQAAAFAGSDGTLGALKGLSTPRSTAFAVDALVDVRRISAKIFA
jgi:hypothetical protein